MIYVLACLDEGFYHVHGMDAEVLFGSEFLNCEDFCERLREKGSTVFNWCVVGERDLKKIEAVQAEIYG